MLRLVRGRRPWTHLQTNVASAVGNLHAKSASITSSRHLITNHRTTYRRPGCCILPRSSATRCLTTLLENSVEEIYQKKTPLEHVLLRPGMYIGSVETTKDTMWMLEDKSIKKKTMHMKQQVVEYVPALYKIFDEIIVNAVDNKVRDPQGMHHLDVTIDPGTKSNGYTPWISIYNDGRGIPIKFHQGEQVYVPELVLGHLLTGSNFDDTSGRLTGGRHGYGAKLTNIFSREFIVETGDTREGLQYKQVWRNNMRERVDPEISPLDSTIKTDYTRVSFSPDLDKFEMTKLSTGMLRVLKKRVLDVAGCLSDVQVTLNGEVIPITGFESYIQNFQYSTTNMTDDTDLPRPDYIFSKVNKRWQIGVLPSDVGFVNVSFVNGMSTLRGGTHVNYITDQICRRIADYINSKYSDLGGITAAHVKPHVAVFINCLIENPTFDSQMKEYMSSKPATYGSSCILSDRFLKMVIANSGIIERVVESARTRQRAALIKKVAGVSSTRSKNNVNVPKLEDANWAGGPRSQECALILTEGDSAKALAVAGLAVVGRDTYGVFPLRGKVLNVRDATYAQLAKNAEFAHLSTILGLKMGEHYDTEEKRKQLRYGKVIVMTDQDHDGSHIKGLLFNLFHTFWPELLQTTGFMSEFITPLLKVTMKKKKQTQSFFSLPEYMNWKSSLNEHDLKQYHIKYYKGLGTSTSAEGREYFSHLSQHLIDFQWSGPSDGDALDMVFSKTRTADRKAWLLNEYSSQSFLDLSQRVVSYKDFVNHELIQFSHADNVRSLPSVIDGLKVSQRKVLYACLKRKLTHELKVAQLAGYCSEHTAYHHGEASLYSTIVNMAQDYVGANNIPLLMPLGQFGTRLQGGKDAASPRYIFTMLQKYTRLVFPEDDDPLLRYVEDDGYAVEPVHYVPILPMILINGTEGIGTGWSTQIPSHHPIQVIDNLIHLLDHYDHTGSTDVSLQPMRPWTKGFRGEWEQVTEQQFLSRGTIEQVNTTTLRISELPVGRWVEDYKKVLWDLVGKKVIRSFSEHHSERDICFELSFTRADLATLIKKHDQESLVKLFKLDSSLSTTNMHAFNAQGKLEKYETSACMLRAFFPIRLQLYQQRKTNMEENQSREVAKLENRIRFIHEVAQGTLQSILQERIPKKKLVQLLQSHGFAPASAFTKNESSNDSEENSDGNEREYDYLLNTPLMSFTQEYAEKLQNEHDTKATRLETLRKTTPTDMWRQELLTLRDTLLQDKEYQ